MTVAAKAAVRLRRGLLKQRRMLAAAALAAAVPAGLAAVAPNGPELGRIVVASHDLSGGRRITADDVRTIAMAKADLPDGAMSDPDSLVGRAVVRSGPARRATYRRAHHRAGFASRSDRSRRIHGAAGGSGRR